MILVIELFDTDFERISYAFFNDKSFFRTHTGGFINWDEYLNTYCELIE